ncbi:MAG: citramalate synthase [Dehalococcoidia bacterium]
MRVEIYDTTLRDGTQMEGLSLSVGDKLEVARLLDDLGVDYIEGGWPGANPKDTEFFALAKSLGLRNAALCAFGSTRRAGTPVEQDTQVQALLDAETPVVTIVGKSWDLHVTEILETTLEENTAMIRDTAVYLKAQGRRVFYDAEHFFDGFQANRDYALSTVAAAARAGAERIILCDTNGGSLPAQIAEAVAAVRERLPDVQIGIHTHNDGELAVANSLAAVEAGATQVQGCINGYGERVGNANLCSVVPNLALKQGLDVLRPGSLERLTEVSHLVSEIANLAPDTHQPFVGTSAFAHKGGLHVAAFMKVAESYQHIDPTVVGNRPRVVVSELSGRGNIVYKLQERGLDLESNPAEAKRILERVKQLEHQGFEFEAAEASFDLLVRRSRPDYRAPFELVDWLVIVERRRRAPAESDDDGLLSEATVKIRIDGELIHTAAEGNGPVNALDMALRKGLSAAYPQIDQIRLLDYKVRILDSGTGTGSIVRVLIESTDGHREWRTVGSSGNIIEASWLALADSLEYWLTLDALS